MSFWVTIPEGGDAQVNQIVELTFQVNDDRAWDVIPDITQPTNKTIPFNSMYQVLLYRTEKNRTRREVKFVGKIIPVVYSNVDAPYSITRTPQAIPVLVIVGAIVAILGLSIAFLTFKEIKALVENPVIETGLTVGLIVGVFILIMIVKKYAKG